MTGKRLVHSFVLVLLSVTPVIPGTALAALPSSATLQFTLTAAGKLSAVHTFDVKPKNKNRCTVRLFAQIGSQTQGTISRARRVAVIKNVKSKSLVFSAKELRAVKNDDGSQLDDPFLTLQTRSTCRNPGGSKQVVISNAFARYIICGKGKREVTKARFMRKLKSEFAD
ncbi:MAG: hypothetical protein D6719_08255 [Candidatus Dadabacteria bacterium]|nr:MAG: hypothetical protein D6719_08255 [Candidatus Dadabacteria bacterium]